MLQLIPSNKTEHLAIVLAEIISHRPLAEPFAAEVILIQSHGMGTWLQQELSSHLGIAALIDCRLPASFFWQLAQSLLSEQPLIPNFEKNNLRWQLLQRLPEKLEDPRYQTVATYLRSLAGGSEIHDHVGAQQEQILFQLSEALADVYDAYQNYRSDWLAAWELGESCCVSGEEFMAHELEQWQADLWRSLYPEQALSDRRHRAHLLEQLGTCLEHGAVEQQAKLPERIFVFGLSALPPQWLPLLVQLSRHCDVHLLIHNPCQYYWADILSGTQRLKLEQALVAKGVSADTAAASFLEGNPLLASWGRLGRDYLSLLYQQEPLKELPVALYEDSADQPAPSALAYVQSDILNLQALERVVDVADDSIRFARCHSRLREVEALHDYLLQLLDRHPELEAKDMLVMMPEVQDFAPLIDAIFARPVYDQRGQAHFLPYGISDQMLTLDQPMVSLLTDILNLSALRITATELLDWLDIEAIRARFDIAEEELPQIHQWVETLVVRWGLTEAHRDQVLAADEPQFGCRSGPGNTWWSAFRRLLAGYIYGADELLVDAAGSVLALTQPSTEVQELAGKLMRLLSVVEQTISVLRGQQRVEEWLRRVVTIWQQWFDEASLDEELWRVMDQSIAAISEQIKQSHFDQAVSFKIVADALLLHLQKERVSQRFLAGRINFCTLMPMRSIPFKVVCMIGMNEGQYPRPEQPVSFDLLKLTPGRMGDRSRRDDDRYLFLEALCSARTHLYISYCAHAASDNSERYPSLLVAELRDYCARYFVLSSSSASSEDGHASELSDGASALLQHWTIDHRLQPFHAQYYQAGMALFGTYSAEWLPLIQPAMVDCHPEAPQPDLDSKHTDGQTLLELREPLELSELQRFADHPLRYYYQRVLNVYYSELAPEMADSEPFALTHLDQYQFKVELAQSWCDDRNSTAQVFARWQASDRLPRAPVDQLQLAAPIESMVKLHEGIGQFSQFRKQTITVDLGYAQVSGEILLADAGQVELKVSKNMAGGFFGYWVKHVFWNLFRAQHKSECEAIPGVSLILTVDSIWSLPELDLPTAERYAQELLACFVAALSQPYPFLPRSTFATLFETDAKTKSAFNGWRLGDGWMAGEREDPYWRRACVLGDWPNGGRPAVPDQLPELQLSLFYQQVQAQIDGIEVRKL